jgi:sulfate transport system permease protein
VADARAARPRPVGAAWIVVGLVALYIGAILLVPLGALVQAVAADLGGVATALVQPDALRALGLSVVLAAVALLLNGVAGIVGALVLTRQRFAGRRLLDALVDLPLAVSPVMTGLAFLLLFGRNGWLGPVLQAMGVKVAFAIPGLVLATVFVTLPFMLREIALVLEEVGTSEEDAASTLGATAWQTFRLVTLPNLREGLTLGATLTVARALGEFGAVLVLGGAISGRTDTATTFIHNAMEERHTTSAYGMALVLAAAAAALLVLLQRPSQTVRGK